MSESIRRCFLTGIRKFDIFLIASILLTRSGQVGTQASSKVDIRTGVGGTPGTISQVGSRCTYVHVVIKCNTPTVPG
ncbi:hypothetical protein DFP73DRAFT_551125 [Morchella snyderi]|nr:hypothetical protein DFP73DRAFT_551125 [Morchella snyderi]